MALLCAGRRGGRGGGARGGHRGRDSRRVLRPTLVASPVEDLELLADAEAPDFVDDGEDLEFYEWAAGEVET